MLLALHGCGDSATPVLQINVVGREFHWYFTYAGSDDLFGTDDDVHVARDLVLPYGRRVMLHVTSHDYVYTFRAPQLDLLETAAPGLSFELGFTPEPRGRFALEVDPMCGLGVLHDNEEMGFLTIMDAHQFDLWLGNQPSEPM